MKKILKQIFLITCTASLMFAFVGVAHAQQAQANVEVHIYSVADSYEWQPNMATGISDGNTGTNDRNSLGTPALHGNLNQALPVGIRYSFDSNGVPTETIIDYSPDDMNGATSSNPGTWNVTGDIPLGFNSTIFNRDNDTIKISSFGFVYLNHGTVTSGEHRFGGWESPMSSVGGKDFLIAGVWAGFDPDNSPTGSDSIRYKFFDAPNKHMTVEFNDVSGYNGASYGGTTFQIKIFESPPIPDTDSDGLTGINDNCPTAYNPDQLVTDITVTDPVTVDFTTDGGSDSIEPGVIINHYSGGPLQGSGIVFDAADADPNSDTVGCITPCTSATFQSTVPRIGGYAMCGYPTDYPALIPPKLAAYDQTVCGRAENGNIYAFDIKRAFIQRNGGRCVYEGSNDPNAWLDCPSGMAQSYVRTGYIKDIHGDACNCRANGSCTAAAWCISNDTPDPDCWSGPIPDTITDLTAQAGANNGEVVLNWSAPADNGLEITDYIIQYDGGTGWTTFTHTASTDLTATVTGLTNFHNYSFQIKATNGHPGGSFSNIVQAMPTPCGVLEHNLQTDDSPVTTIYETCMGVTVEGGSLYLEHIPYSLSFPQKFALTTAQDSFSNDDPLTVGTVDVSTAPDDILTVSDMRNSGGFRVTITADTLSNGADTIPLSNLYLVTTYPGPNDFGPPIDDAGLIGMEEFGVEWAAGSRGAHDTVTPEFTTENLNLAGTYTAHDNFFNEQTGNPDVLTLMETNTNHIARVSQALSFYLNIPANQPPGTYAVTFTMDLIDIQP
jgi:hypothetical protein